MVSAMLGLGGAPDVGGATVVLGIPLLPLGRQFMLGASLIVIHFIHLPYQIACFFYNWKGLFNVTMRIRVSTSYISLLA